MHTYTARISWNRGDAALAGGRYSRGHEWSFDGGLTVPASASPHHVRLPYSVAAAVDPEEALVAAASSCHMLSFLWEASKQGFEVERYVDEASGIMEPNPSGRLAFSRITLRPQITFTGTTPGPDQLDALHHAAHDACYIANSLKCDVVIEGLTEPSS